MKQASFSDARCSIARTLDKVGQWWALLIIRDAMMGVRRFRDFERSLGISKNTLAARLTELVDNGIMIRVNSTSGAKYLDYELTDKGRDLAPIVMALAQWGDRWSVHEDGPSIAILDGKSGKEIPRLWPRDAEGKIIDLVDIRLRRNRNSQSANGMI